MPLKIVFSIQTKNAFAEITHAWLIKTSTSHVNNIDRRGHLNARFQSANQIQSLFIPHNLKSSFCRYIITFFTPTQSY